ncbi:unnamed protein product [Bemisia tabaci]|uniref:Uncharacterized protein n=1 Tax=Bemisia tabaci TaxID=7038 RepID=A0A9P0A1C8_BEMTA|nr:unnamed protein product [Bemisia tabaci]
MSSYGVYGEETDDGDEEGFSKTSKETAVYYPEPVLVVSKQKDGSTTSVLRSAADLEARGGGRGSGAGCFWCSCSEKRPNLDVDDQMASFDTSGWCKPAVLLIVLVLLLVLFFVEEGRIISAFVVSSVTSKRSH